MKQRRSECLAGTWILGEAGKKCGEVCNGGYGRCMSGCAPTSNENFIAIAKQIGAGCVSYGETDQYFDKIGYDCVWRARGVDCGEYVTKGAQAFCFCGDTATATGDPHVTNIKGEVFNIHAEGLLPMIILPRGVEPDAAEMAILAQSTITSWESPCDATYLTKVEVFARAGCGHAVMTIGDEEAPIVKLDELDSQKCDEQPSFSVIKESAAARIVVKNITVEVFKKTMYNVSWLDLFIKGLPYRKEIGGLLGLDDHSDAIKIPEKCATKEAAVSRKPGNKKSVQSRIAASLAG